MSSCPQCGCDIEPAGKARSLPQLRRYFALIRAAYHHWPDSHPVQFADATGEARILRAFH